MEQITQKQSIGIRLNYSMLSEVRQYAKDKGVPTGTVLRLLCEWAWKKYRPFYDGDGKCGAPK